jgi:FkbM family methyltransferase
MLDDRRLFYLLFKAGIPLDTVWDIGAHTGQWTSRVSGFGFMKNSNFVMFEANDIHKSRLASIGFPYFLGLLGAANGYQDFYSIDGTGDSTYKEKTSYYQQSQPRSLPVSTLDFIAVHNSLMPPDLIKIDVQGAEIDVFMGALNSLKTCKVIQCEVSLVEYNSGAPDISDVIDFLKEINFVPYSIIEGHWHEKCLTQLDILFISKEFLGLLQ